MDENTEYAVKVILDDTTYMMFDLDNGNFLDHFGEEVAIDDLWKFKYKRIPIEESLENGVRRVVSHFFIKVWYNDILIMDFEVNGAHRKFTVKTFEGMHAAMFQDVLDDYRKSKFNIS